MLSKQYETLSRDERFDILEGRLRRRYDVVNEEEIKKAIDDGLIEESEAYQSGTAKP